jgi:tetratricopeptide (TPR) repeat protein
MTALANWARELGQDVADLPDVSARHQEAKRLIGQRHLLLVIDDAWTIESAHAMRCGGPNCCHLLTTRDQGLARAFAEASHARSVPTLEEEPAYKLLCELAPEACAVDPKAAQALANAVDGLPLALELVGGYLATPEHRIFPALSQAAMAEMANPRQRLKLVHQRLGSLQDKVLTLQESIALSLEGLPAEITQAFYDLGAFAPKPAQFSLQAAETVTQADAVSLACLVARNLVAVEGEQPMLALHQTLADMARTALDEAARARHRDYYLAFVEEDPDDWHRIEAVYNQLQWAWQALPEGPVLLDWIGALWVYQERRGLWQDYLAWANRALPMVRYQGLQKEERGLLIKLGFAYKSLGEHNKALDYFQQARPLCEAVGDRAGLAVTLNNIGASYDALGERDKALNYYQQARPLCEAVGDRAGLAGTLNNIGAVCDALGEHDKALDYYQQARPLYEAVGDRAGLARTLTNIGEVYNALGEHNKALDCYQQAWPLRKAVSDRAGLAVTLNNIGVVCDALGEHDKALDYYQQARPLYEAVDDREGLAVTLNNIGEVYNALGKHDKALDYYQQARPLREAVGDRAGLARTLTNIGAVYYALEEHDKALDYYQQARPLCEAVGDREVLAVTLTFIGAVYDDLGKRDKALYYYQQARPLWEAVDDRAGLATTQYNMAMIYRAQGRFDEAIIELKRVIELDELMLSPDLEAHRIVLSQVIRHKLGKRRICQEIKFKLKQYVIKNLKSE